MSAGDGSSQDIKPTVIQYQLKSGATELPIIKEHNFSCLSNGDKLLLLSFDKLL